MPGLNLPPAMGATHRIDRVRLERVYTMTEVAKLAQTSVSSVRRWIRGYAYGAATMEPVFGKRDPSSDSFVSFMELSELVAVVGFRAAGVKLELVRRAHSYAKQVFKLEYPFATLELYTSGGHVLHKFEEKEHLRHPHLVLDLEGQFTLPGIVATRVRQFDFDADGVAVRWFPRGKNVPIVVDPYYVAGSPIVVGTRLSVETIVKRSKAGDPPDLIASDFELTVEQVEAVLQYAA